MNKSIAVAGTGYVGLSISVLLAQHNHVVAVDIIPEKIALINQKKSPIQDEYIEKYLSEKELDLTATSDGESAYAEADFVVVATPTNYDSRKNHFDTSAVEAVLSLFDEIEKAHPDVFNVLLQVLDDGRITDSQGRTVDFKNTILIMTSNIGSQYLLDGIQDDGSISEEARNLVMQDLRAHFRPEFLNRLDETIMFKPLTKDNIGHIVDLLLKGLNKRLADQELTVELSPAAKQFVIEGGYDPVYGARPLKRFVQKEVETSTAKLILGGQVSEGDTILLDVENGGLKAMIKPGVEVVDE